MPEFSQAQIMLSLSLLSYRGFWNPKNDNQSNLAGTLTRGLEKLEPLRGDWKLVWGPTTYRYLGSAFDSSMMYVVQHRRQLSRYAIVVRGTNPVDLFDWLLGDFLAHRQVPWRTGDNDVAPGASVSLSTALGIKILLNMRADVDREYVSEPGKFDFLFDLGVKAASNSQDGAKAALSASASLMDATAMTPAYKKTRKFLRRMLKYQKIPGLAEHVTGNAASTLHKVFQGDEVLRILSMRRRLVKLLEKSRDKMSDAPVAMLMPSLEELLAKNLPGVGFLELLGNLADIHGDSLELFVTGHSKGGALAPALALFLSDTQKNDEMTVPHHYQWNPHCRAAIHCYAFAGPTPGNSAFAAYFNRQLGSTFFRYANKLDIVTRVWASDQMRDLSHIYGNSVNSPPGLDSLFQQIIDEIEDLDYSHPGQDYEQTNLPGNPVEKHVFEFSGPLKENISSYLLQELYQHVGAYIDQLDLGKLIKLKDILGSAKVR